MLTRSTSDTLSDDQIFGKIEQLHKERPPSVYTNFRLIVQVAVVEAWEGNDNRFSSNGTISLNLGPARGL